MSECPHVAELPRPEPAPLSETCPECLAIGSHPVQLRHLPGLRARGLLRLLAPPARHAHFKETGHPVMRSFEPGETWRWCFVDGSIV